MLQECFLHIRGSLYNRFYAASTSNTLKKSVLSKFCFKIDLIYKVRPEFSDLISYVWHKIGFEICIWLLIVSQSKKGDLTEIYKTFKTSFTLQDGWHESTWVGKFLYFFLFLSFYIIWDKVHFPSQFVRGNFISHTWYIHTEVTKRENLLFYIYVEE